MEPELEERLHGYQAAIERVAFFRQPQASYLRLSGPDRSAFLQRQTTNDLGCLEPGKVLLTVLTSPTARILDVFALLQEGEGDAGVIEIIPLPGRPGHAARYLKSRIFFNDKVRVSDDSEQFVQYDLLGPQTVEALRQVGVEALPEMDRWITAPYGDGELRVLASGGPLGLGNRVLVPAGAAEGFEQALLDAGAERLAPESYLILRVEAGLPEAGYELTEDFTPLEINLTSAVADNKGCYTGQEVIARQITYDKVTQLLRGLRLEFPVPPESRVWVDGKNAGVITSAVESPRFGPIALAVIKRAYNEPGTAVKVGSSGQEAISGVIVPLPFHSV